MFFRGTKLELAALLTMALILVLAVGWDVSDTTAQAQTMTQQDTFVWPEMHAAVNKGNGVYFYRPDIIGGAEKFADDLAAFKGAHPNIRISAMTAFMAGAFIVNCEQVVK